MPLWRVIGLPPWIPFTIPWVHLMKLTKVVDNGFWLRPCGIAGRQACMCAVKFDRTAWLGCSVMRDTRSTDDTDRRAHAVTGKQATTERPFLDDPPGAGADVRGIVSDFDGVLNRIGPGSRDRLPHVIIDGYS